MDNKRSSLISALSLVATIFGVMTVISGSAVLFGGVGAEKLAGDYVLFVVRFNALAGFFYVAAGVLLWRGSLYAVRLSLAIAVATLVVLGFFALHIFNGGAYEMRTVIALTFRSGLWFLIAFFANRSLAQKV